MIIQRNLLERKDTLVFGSLGKVAWALALRSRRPPDRLGHTSGLPDYPNSQLGSSTIPVWDRVSGLFETTILLYYSRH